VLPTKSNWVEVGIDLIRDTLDRLRSTRVGKKSKYDSAEHEEMAQKYEKKKRFHEATKKPKEESLKEKAIKKIMAKGKDLQEKSKQHAINELKNSKSKKSKKNKTKQSEPKREASFSKAIDSDFSFGFDNNQSNEQYGFGMFNHQKQEGKPKQEEVDWSKIYDFRTESDSKRRKYNPFGSFYP